MFRSVFRVTLTLLALVGCGPALAQNRVALVIGQSAYRAVTPLPNPANDARAMAQLLGEAGFDVMTTSNLSQTELREKVGAFAARIAEKGPDTIALMFYAGHGLQIDGENYLVPVDIDPKRETDIPLQAVRLNDILNTLTSVPSRMRFILLDACRNNPFADLTKTAGRGLALIDTKATAPGMLLSYSTAPGAEAEDGTGSNSPYTAALLNAAREPGRSVEDTLKRTRLAVNKATEGRQTPWESSSLTDDFRFFNAIGVQDAQASADAPKQVAAVNTVTPVNAAPNAVTAPNAPAGGAPSATTAPPTAKRTVEDWKRALQGKSVDEANDIIVSDGSADAYEAFVLLYASRPLGEQAKLWLDRHKRMTAWNRAVLENTAAGYRTFLVAYPDSDLTATALKLELRLRNKPAIVNIVAAPVSTAVVAALGPTCPCTVPTPTRAVARQKKAAAPQKQIEPDPQRRQAAKPPRRLPPPDDDDDDVVVVRRAPPPGYAPVAPIVGGIIGGGGGYGRPSGGYGGGGYGGNSGGGVVRGGRY